MKYIVYSDGSSLGNPGPAGWAAYIVETQKLVSGELRRATNNEAEMSAVLYALGEIPDCSEVVIVTDSKLVIGWLCQNWKTKSNPNIGELRKSIFILREAKKLDVSFKWVKGHTTDQWNNLVDMTARNAARMMAKKVIDAQEDRPSLHLTLQIKNLGIEDWPLLLRAIDSIGGIPSGLVEEVNADLEIVQSKSI